MALHPLDLVTPLVIVYNEEANIRRTLASLAWAPRVVVVDSGSTDNTLTIMSEFHNVDVFRRSFDTFAAQCNYGLSLIRTPWCLSLDADHIVTHQFYNEMFEILSTAPDDVTAIYTPFRYLVFGKPLRGTLLPCRFNLVRPLGGAYLDDGHAHRFVPVGSTMSMRKPIHHDDRKSLDRWLASQHRYQRIEAHKLLKSPNHLLSLSDRLRKFYVIAPVAVLLICLVRHGGLLDGWRGLYYALQRVYAELLLSLMLLEESLSFGDQSHR